MVPEASRREGGLKELPHGRVHLGGILFEIRGVVQLAAHESRLRRATFPAAARGIPLPAACRQVHFLHGTDRELPKRTVVGRIVIHFEEGPAAGLPLRYGEELGAFFSSDRAIPGAVGSAIAWEHESAGHFRHQTVYRTTWTNPRPEARTVMADYESTVARQGLCLLAITAEP